MDYRFIENHRAQIQSSLAKRGDEFNLDEVDQLNRKRKDLQKKFDEEKSKLNELSKQIGMIYQKKGDPKEAQNLKEKSLQIKSEIQALSTMHDRIESELNQKLLYLPNILDETVVEGQGEQDNPIVREYGDPVVIEQALDHDDIANNLGILNVEASAKVSGSRFSYLVGWGARLERALVNFMLDCHRDFGYVEISTPLLVHQDAMEGTGQLPKFKEDAFVTQSPELYLIPTAEVPVTNYYRHQILSEDQLPQKFVCYSPCFRREAGSYGKDTKGLIRQHQFHKVELVQFVKPEESQTALEELTSHAEHVLQQLKLPYRVTALCSKDIGFSASKTYDIEVWLAGQNTYREISSCSNFLDFQARRASIKYKTQGKNQYVHTLNGSGLAVGRTLVAILENYQQKDGSVLIPKVLQPYLGTDRIG